MGKISAFFLVLSLTVSPQAFAFETEFSQENASAILKTLVVEIGPRPMGSPAEQRALQFAVEKFREYGCDTNYLLPMTVAANVNTKSGVAVGVKKGKTGRIIVIGGHIDTSGPDVPGANDDGSGTACVIELARVLSRRENQSTVYFCCWGGEEQGLRGSQYFVDTFAHIDSIALMLQLDMADGSSFLLADPDGSDASAPSWLVQSAFDIFYNGMHSSGDLVYQSAASTLSLAAGGAFGSDHIPFIDKGIPAIDFTSDVTFPIHTPQDNWENFTHSGLKRSGDLVLKLFEKYDGGVPTRTTERYQLVQIGSTPFFLPYPLLWAFIGMSVVAAIVAYAVTRRRRTAVDPSSRVRWSRFKLLMATLVIQTFIWSSETIIGFIRGYRFPWVNNSTGFFLLGILFGLIALWLILRAALRYRLSGDAHVYTMFSLVPLMVLTLACAFMTPELGMYVAASLLGLSLALVARSAAVKLTLFVGSVLVMHSLLFFDGHGLLQRLIALNQIPLLWHKVLLHLAFIVLFTIITLPFVHGFAAIYRGSGVDLLWLKRFRAGGGFVVVLLAAAIVSGYLIAQPVYDAKWFNTVRVEHRYDANADSGALAIRGSEYLDGLGGTVNGRDTVFSGRINSAMLEEAAAFPVRWLDVSHELDAVSQTTDTTWRLGRTLTLRSLFRPLRVNVIYESDSPFEVTSPWAHGARSRETGVRETDRRKVFRWYAFPDSHLVIPVHFALKDSQAVMETVDVMFDSAAYPIRLSREFTNIEYRTTVVERDSFAAHAQ